MGMPIEDIILELEEAKEYPVSNEAINYALDTIHKYLLMQSDYENRLKADMVAMLTEIQLEIEENQIIAPQDTFYDKKLDGQFNRGISKASEIIQQKINSLSQTNNN